MAYSEDLRHRVRLYVSDGGLVKEAAKIFSVSIKSASRWVNNHEPRRKPGRKGADKLDEAALLRDVQRYPDKLLRERAKDFDMSVNGIAVALKRLGIKKNTTIWRKEP